MWSHPGILEGRFVRLEPLTLDHRTELFPHFDDETGRYLNEWRPSSEPEEQKEILSWFTNQPGFFPFALIEKQTEKAIGSSSFYDLRESNLSLEVGHTWIAARYRQTQVNPEIKLLMLGYAFETFGCIRVQLKTDNRNERSKAAMLKLGVKAEGVLRHHVICKDGFVRDTVMFSILKEEWPQIKVRLLERLEEFDRNLA